MMNFYDIKCAKNIREKHKAKWMYNFNQVKLFIETYGTYPTTKTNKYLNSWVNGVRGHKVIGLLDKEKLQLIESLPDWSWTRPQEVQENFWMEKYKKVQKILDTYYGGKIPPVLGSLKDQSEELYRWVSVQRSKMHKGELSRERELLFKKFL